MNKIIGVVVIVLLAGGILFFTFGEKEEETIKMAALLWLSNPLEGGGDATVGIANIRNGLLLAAEEINKKGGINGKSIELIISDTEGSPQKAEELFREIEKEHQPLVYFVVIDSVSLVLEELAMENEVILLSGTSAPTTDWTFGYYPSVETEIKPVLSMLKKQEIESLGVLYVNSEFGQTLFGELDKAFRATGGTVRAKSFNLGTTDFREHVAQLLEQDAIEIISFREDTISIVKELESANYAGSIFISSNNIAPDILKLLPPMENIYAPASGIYNPSFALGERVKEKYGAKYEGEFDFTAALGYDTLSIFDGLLEGEDLSRGRVKEVLESGFVYNGAFGIIDVQPGEHDISPPLYEVQIFNGSLEYLK